MKKLITTIAIAISTVAFGQQLKYTDVYFLTDAQIKAFNIDTNKTYELKDIKYIVPTINSNFIKSEYCTDDYLVGYFNAMKFVPGGLFGLNVDKFPKTANAIISTYSPVKKQLCQKYKKITFSVRSNDVAIDDIIAYLNSNEFESYEITDINEAIKSAGLKVIKRWLRKNGKTFVAKKDAKGNVIDNPLTAPMKELTDALNGAKYAGLNEWSQKYDAQWNKLEFSWLLSDEKINALKEDILIDEQQFSDENIKQLRVALGVNKFNEFVKLYNDGVSK